LVNGAALSGSGRVLRGGAWNNNPRNCRSAYRNNNDPDERNDNIGFRVVSLSFGLALPLRGSSSVPGIPAFTDARSVATEVLALLLSCRAGVPATESTSQDRAGLVGDCIRTCRAAILGLIRFKRTWGLRPRGIEVRPSRGRQKREEAVQGRIRHCCPLRSCRRYLRPIPFRASRRSWAQIREEPPTSGRLRRSLRMVGPSIPQVPLRPGPVSSSSFRP